MATNQHTLLRQWHMLKSVPRGPRKISVRELQSRLSDAEFIVTERTIQRDLQELTQVFPLMVDERSRPFGWSWQQDSPSFDLPGLSVAEALALTLVEQQLSNSLPPVTLDTLRPHFRSAQQALSAIDPCAPAKAWLQKVRAIPPMQRLVAPDVDAGCQRTIYDALLRDRQLKLIYRKRETQLAVEYVSVHPLAIIQRGQLIYLVCMFADYEDVRTLAMHRVVQAEMLFLDSRKKEGFTLDAYIESGHMGVRNGEPIILRALFSKAAGEHLFETPLVVDQILAPLPDGRLELTATLPNTHELRWWLLGLGDGVEVLEPLTMRAEMQAVIHRMAAHYR